MKAVMIVLLIFVAACLIFPTIASGSLGQMSGLGAEKPQWWACSSDSKRMEDKMAEALRGLDVQKKANTDIKKGGSSNSLADALNGASSLNNSTSKVTSLDNSSLSNSTVTNSMGLNSSAAGGLSTNSSAGLQNVGASSKGSFNGYLGITASRHETGKSDIKSSMFLSGGFDVDKTVQFSDRGF
ncbi:Uncharacterised protein [uncultured archaeon]|nr:Uncharacterised protein [uncultured archaeon]